MKKPLFSLVVLAAFILGACGQQSPTGKPNQAGTSKNSVSDTLQIKSLIEKDYVQAFENADTAVAARLFVHTADASFIHPRGHEHGWKEIKKNIYQFFGTTFSTRKLTVSNEKITVYGDVAWVEFYWVFDATFKKDGRALQTKGRETEVWRKIANEWHLVHVHYSNMPVTGARKGF